MPIPAHKVFCAHAVRLSYCFGVDGVVDSHVPFVVETSFGRSMGNARPGCECICQSQGFVQQFIWFYNAIEESPPLCFVTGERASRVQQFARLPLADNSGAMRKRPYQPRITYNDQKMRPYSGACLNADHWP